MTKILSSLLAAASLILAASSCSPLKIVMDSTNKGQRTVLTSDKNLFTVMTRGSFNIALGARVSPKDTVLAILLTADTDDNHGIFDLEDRLMFRLSDQSEVFLKNVYEKQFETTQQTNVSSIPKTDYYLDYTYSPWTGNIYVTPYEVNTMVTQVYTTKKNNSYALYLVSKHQMESIISKGVVKLRVEVEDQDYDMADPSSVSGLLSDMYSFLMESVRSKKQRSTF